LLPKEVASETTIVTAQVGDDYDWLPMSAAPRQQIPSDIAEQELYDDSEPPDSEPLIGLGATVRLHEDATNDIWSPSSSSSPLLRQQENIRGSFQENNPTNGRPRAEEQTGVIDRGALIPSLNSITARRLRVAPTRRSRMPQWLDEALRAPPFEFAGLRVRPIDVTLATIALIIWAAALLRWILLR
jgi:hypothetical protein